MACIFEIDHRSFFIGLAIAYGLATEIWGLTVFMWEDQTDLRKVSGILIGVGGLSEFVAAHFYAFNKIGRKVYGSSCFVFGAMMLIGIILYLVKDCPWNVFKEDLIIHGVLAVVGFNVIFLVISGIFYIMFLKRSANPALSVAIVGQLENKDKPAEQTGDEGGDTTVIATPSNNDQGADQQFKDA